MKRRSGLQRLSGYRYPDNDSRGSILVIVLWSLCLLSVFAVIMGYETRQEISLVKRLDNKSRGRLIAEAGIKSAIVVIKKEEAKGYDLLQDGWAGGALGNNFKDILIGEGKFTVCYNYRDEKTGLYSPRYGMVDEDRKINLNTTDMATLKALFRLVFGADEVSAQDLAASVVDWRDNDSELSIPLGSAEESYYRLLPYPYGAKNTNYEVIDELCLVKGFDPAMVDRIKDYVTVYGVGRVNVNTAPREVLLSLGLSGKLVDNIIDFRYGKDGILGTADDGIFENQSSIVPKLSQMYNMDSAEIGLLSTVVEKSLSVYSNNFMINSTTKLAGGKIVVETVSVVNRKGRVLYWQEK